MKSIIVKTTFKGFHKWSNAPKPVDFLKSLHRHLFVVFLKIEVFHNDREVEFFMLQSDLENFIKKRIAVKKDVGSCEEIAEQILKNFENYNNKKRCCEVQVWEDMENGAIISNEKI